MLSIWVIHNGITLTFPRLWLSFILHFLHTHGCIIFLIACTLFDYKHYIFLKSNVCYPLERNCLTSTISMSFPDDFYLMLLYFLESRLLRELKIHLILKMKFFWKARTYFSISLSKKKTVWQSSWWFIRIVLTIVLVFAKLFKRQSIFAYKYIL